MCLAVAGVEPFLEFEKTNDYAAKVLAALKANSHSSLGALEFDIPNNPRTRTFVALNIERIFPAFKFYVRQETPYEPCAAIIVVPMRLEIDPPLSETRMQLTLRVIERETLSVECGDKLPF